MKYVSAFLLLFLLAAIFVTAGCTTTDGTTTTTTATNQTGGTTTWTFTTLTTSVPCSRGTISGEVLAGYMPGAMDGWVMPEDMPACDSYQGDVCDYTRAYRAYLNNPGGVPTLGVGLEFYDSNYDTEAMDMFAWIGMWPDFTTATGYEKAVTFNGYQGWERVTTDEAIIVWVVVGNGIYLEYQLSGVEGEVVTGSSDTGLLYPFIYATDLNGLAALA